jgi:hypothetical protein
MVVTHEGYVLGFVPLFTRRVEQNGKNEKEKPRETSYV